MPAFLAGSDIVVCLLPLTPETHVILGADLFSRLPIGAELVHCGSGAHLNSDAVLASLHSGQVASAMLDVTNPEPLPDDHPFWSHPGVILTPHVASVTDFEEGAAFCARAIEAHLNRNPIPGLVRKKQRY